MVSTRDIDIQRDLKFSFKFEIISSFYLIFLAFTWLSRIGPCAGEQRGPRPPRAERTPPPAEEEERVVAEEVAHRLTGGRPGPAARVSLQVQEQSPVSPTFHTRARGGGGGEGRGRRRRRRQRGGERGGGYG